MNRLEIFLLGTLKIQFDGIDINEALRTKKERALLAYLAEESTHAHQRQTIAEFFWPDRPESYARMNLRQAILGIKKSFDNEENANAVLKITEEAIGFNAKAGWVDTQAFSEHIALAKNHKHTHLHTCQDCIEHLIRAVEFYRGDFLEDLLLGDVTAFQEWIVFRRERYFRTMLDALQLLTRVYYKQDNYDQAYFYAWRYVDQAPLEEPAHRLLMRLLALSGRRSAALQQYEFCKGIIEREFGIEPSVETQQLYVQIKGGLPIEKIDTGSLSSSEIPTQPINHHIGPPTTRQLYDPNTHIPIRALFMDRLRHTITRMARAQLMAAVCKVSVNVPQNPALDVETLNQVQQHLARRLVGSVRECDTVAQMSDFEFGVILEEIRDETVLPAIAEKILKSVGAVILVGGQRIRIKAAIGYSVFPKQGNDPVVLLNQADIAMRTSEWIADRG